MDLAERKVKAAIVLHDADTKFTKEFKQVLNTEKIQPKQVLPVSPYLNAYVKRFIQTIQQKCLEHFVVLEEMHLDYLGIHHVDHWGSTLAGDEEVSDGSMSKSFRASSAARPAGPGAAVAEGDFAGA